MNSRPVLRRLLENFQKPSIQNEKDGLILHRHKLDLPIRRFFEIVKCN